MIKLARAAEGRRQFHQRLLYAHLRGRDAAGGGEQIRPVRGAAPAGAHPLRTLAAHPDKPQHPQPALERASLEPWEAEVYQKISEA